MQITKNIFKHELKCKCGNCEVYILEQEPVIQIVQETCDYFAKAFNVKRVTLIITSAARCYVYNSSEEVGSNDNSQHPRARAIDFKLFLPDSKPIDPKAVYAYLDKKYPTSLGLGAYVTFTHCDTRPYPARW